MVVAGQASQRLPDPATPAQASYVGRLHSVNPASRVEGPTKDTGFAILVTGAVHERLPGALKALCRPLGERAVKGRRATVGVFGVTDDPGGEAASGVDSEDTVGAAAGAAG